MEFQGRVLLKENSLKTCQLSPTTDIDMILLFPRGTSLCECHRVCDEIEKRICSIYANASISIHSEPECYNKTCQNFCLNRN